MAGRKRKAGQRTKSGKRLSRAKDALEARFDRGSEWVQEMRRRYGEHYGSAIGRAFAAGLLGEGNEAKDRFDNARKLAALRRRIMGGDSYRCALNQTPRGMNDDGPDEVTDQDIANHEWLLVNLKRIEDTNCAAFFDQLMSRQFTDYGPPWLDRLLESPKDRRDTIILDAAIKGIDAIGAVSARVVAIRRVA